MLTTARNAACGSMAALLLGACVSHPATPRTLRDDAQRIVALPARVARVFAAGAPAELLLYTLVPEMLVGRNHQPSAVALSFMPEQFRNPVPISVLPSGRNGDSDAELLALKPDVYIDYGNLDTDYIAAVNAIQQRTGIPSAIFDGQLQRVPATYRRLGSLLGVAQRGELLAREAERILRRYRGTLARAGRPVRLYLSCGAISVPCVAGQLTAETVDLLGAINVAGNVTTAPQRPVTADDLHRWHPDLIVMQTRAAAERLRVDPAWQSVAAVREGRVCGPPDVPFSWGTRPPSVNRLLNLIWLAHVAGGPSAADYESEVRRFFRLFYQVELSDEQWRQLHLR